MLILSCLLPLLSPLVLLFLLFLLTLLLHLPLLTPWSVNPVFSLTPESSLSLYTVCLAMSSAQFKLQVNDVHESFADLTSRFY